MSENIIDCFRQPAERSPIMIPHVSLLTKQEQKRSHAPVVRLARHGYFEANWASCGSYRAFFEASSFIKTQYMQTSNQKLSSTTLHRMCKWQYVRINVEKRFSAHLAKSLTLIALRKSHRPRQFSSSASCKKLYMMPWYFLWPLLHCPIKRSLQTGTLPQ